MLSIPEDKLPDEFKDASRLDSLFSPFRTRTTNPRDYTSKVSSWKQLITLYCSTNGVYSFTLSSLNSLFIRNGRPPSCLTVVVDELIKSGEIQTWDEFMKKSAQTWGGWATDLLVKNPISWSFNTIKKSLFTNTINPECVYVHLVVIREESQKLLAIFPEKHKNKVVNFTDFFKLIEKDLKDTENVKLLLHYLVQEQKADVIDLKNKNSNVETILVKIAHDNKIVPISEVEVGVYVLEKNEEIFTKHVEDLEDEIAACVKTVKEHLLKGHRQLAKTWLKKKHEIDKRLTRKITALHNIQVLLEQIRDVHSDAEVWQSYKHALSAFDTTFKETGLSEEAVENTMLQMGDMLDMHEDIQNAISKPVITDETDLEQELAELMQSDVKPDDNDKGDGDLEEQLGELNINTLPDVPKVKIPEKIDTIMF